MTEAAQEATAAEAAKAKRAAGVVSTQFATADKADHKRVPQGVLAVLVNGKSYDVVKGLSQDVKDQLAAYAFASRAKSYANNHANKDLKDEAAKADVAKLVDEVFAELVAGRLYSVTEGAAKDEPKFDTSEYLQAAEQGAIQRNKRHPEAPLTTPELLAKLDAKIMALEGKARTGFLLTLRQDPFIGPCYSAIVAKRKMAENDKPKEGKKKSEKQDALSALF